MTDPVSRNTSSRVPSTRTSFPTFDPDPHELPPGRASGPGLRVFGVMGGGYKSVQGILEAREGEYVQGAGDIAVGGATVASEIAFIAGRTALGTATGGAAAAIDGAKDMYLGIRDRDAERFTVGAIKEGAGAAMIAGLLTANPILIGGGAGAYLGASIFQSRHVLMEALGMGYEKVSALVS